MAIGDHWDTSYNPKITNLRHKITGQPPWNPDYSDQTPQTDALNLKERGGGRFCTEGCGCVDTGASNLHGSKCILPPEIAVTIMRTPDGRYEARSAIGNGEGETFHLKFDRGVWRGSKCCSHNSHGELLYACDPCKVTTLPNGKPSECHYANNKYKTINSGNQKGDGFPNRGPWDYDAAIGKGNSSDTIWPRRGVDSWMQPSVYKTPLPNDQVAMHTDPALVNITGHDSEFSANHLTARTNIKGRERSITVDSDGYLTNYTIDNGSSPDPKVSNIEIQFPHGDALAIGCLEDGAVPLKKRPWCRNAISGERMQQRCTDTALEGACYNEQGNYVHSEDNQVTKGECDVLALNNSSEKYVFWGEDPDGKPLYGDKASCLAAGEQWLYDNEDECGFSGACKTPEGEVLEPGCFYPLSHPILPGIRAPMGDYRDQKHCEQDDLEWRYSSPGSCIKYGGELDLLAHCRTADGQNFTEDADQQECEKNGHIWYKNSFHSNEWVDWEYERRSCCGNVMLSESHPFHTPQIAGGAANARKSTTCFTPYSEVILTPNMMSGTTAPMAGHGGGSGMSIASQADRDWFFYDQSDYWTLVIRPCNFWGSCFEEGQTRKDPAEMGECRDESNEVITKGKYSSGYGRCEEADGEQKGVLNDSSGDPVDTEEKCADYEKTFNGKKSFVWNKEGNKTDNEERCTENDGKWIKHPDNYYETTCGEEVVLFLPIDQFMNCSDFNLTLSTWSVCEKDGEIIESATHAPNANTAAAEETCKELEGTFTKTKSNRSGWPESNPAWNPLMGNLMGNPAGSETLQGGFPMNGFTYGDRGFPGDAIEKNQHKNWCSYPDGNWDGVADGDGYHGHCIDGSGEVVDMGEFELQENCEAMSSAGNVHTWVPDGHRSCSRYTYWNSNGGAYYNELQNAHGTDAFYGFNIQPQPFKATEEKQTRAKTMDLAAKDQEAWQMCADSQVLWNGGGHWFWEKGPDYFFYYDFVKWDEIGLTGKPGTARQMYVKEGIGYCSKSRAPYCELDEKPAVAAYCPGRKQGSCSTSIEEGCWFAAGEFDEEDFQSTDEDSNASEAACLAYLGGSDGYWQPAVTCTTEPTCKGAVVRDGDPVTTCGGAWTEGAECTTPENCAETLVGGGCDSTWIPEVDAIPCISKGVCEDPDKCNSKWIPEKVCGKADCDKALPDGCDGTWVAGACETVSSKAQKWIDGHVGQLGRGNCPDSPPLYVGWIQQSSIEKMCPPCETVKIETDCGKIGTCQHPDGSFDQTSEENCSSKGRCFGPTGEVILDEDGNPVDKQFGECVAKEGSDDAECVGVYEDSENCNGNPNCTWTKGACDDYKGATWKDSEYKSCCEWISGCTIGGEPGGIPGEVVVGYGKGEDTCTRNGVLIKRPNQDACEVDGGTWQEGEEGSVPITRPAKDKEECEKEKVYEEPFDGGAGAIWYEQCIISQALVDSLNECPPIGRIPDGLLDIVLGDQIGTCILHKDLGDGTCQDKDGETVDVSNESDCTACGGSAERGPCKWTVIPANVSISGMTETECGVEALKEEYLLLHGENETILSPAFSPDTIGSSDSSYTVRENELIKLRPAGPATSNLPDVTAIKDGRSAAGYYETEFGLKRNLRLPAGNDVGHSMSYWHNTGLWPRGELSSYVNDHCQGLSQQKRIVNASNERPIKITARDHLLKDGDLVDITGVMGNFGANVMTNRDWTEMQWEDKIYKECQGDSCDEIAWPNSVCPETTKCLDENGEEVPNKDALTCSNGECDKKRPSGTECENETECIAEVGENTAQDANGDCPFGYTKDDSKGPYEKDGCINNLDGCGGTWTSGAKNVWTTYCDSEKFFSCYGTVIGGKEPPPAPFFVIKNTTVDTFDLYTCDKYPVDGTIQNPINLDPAEFSGSSKTSLAWYTVYAHMTDISVGVGETVEKGQQIGKVGNIGGEVNHLHFVVAEHRTQKVVGENYCAGGAVECVSFDPRFGIGKCRSSYRNEPRPRSENKYSAAEISYIQSTLSFPLDSSKNWRRPLFSYLHVKDGYFAEDYYVYPEGSCNIEAAIEADLSKGEPVYVASGGGEIVSKVKAIVGNEGAVIVEHKVATNGQIGCPDETPRVCAANPGIPTYERVVESANFTVYKDPDKNSGLPAIYPFIPRCIDTNDKDVTPAPAESECLSPNRWITGRNLKDNPETKKVEGEAFCSTYGTCMVVDNAYGVDNSFMTKNECLLLAETYHTYSDSKQIFVRKCIDGDGNEDTSQNATKSQEACEIMHSKCLDENDQNTGDADKASCDKRREQGQNVRWSQATLTIKYNDCAEQTGLFAGNVNFDRCWEQAQWKSIADLDVSVSGSTANSLGVPTVGVYKVCPFTGDLLFINSRHDPGIEAGYAGHLGQDELDDMYRFGFGGSGYKWEDRANDYYVQIEQKGTCPVCCDHFMPPNLTATLTGQSSDILNVIGCGFDECANGPLHDGWCCSDGSHSCNMSDLADCEKNPEAFGRCQGEDGRDISFIGANRRPACEKAGGTFTPMSELEEFKDGEAKNHCNMFLRKMIVHHTTNCRRCSDVYSSQHKVPMYDGPPGPVDYNGESCCPNCECTFNESDNSTQGCSYDYPTCTDVIACLRGGGFECDSKNVGMVKNVGKVEATCTEIPNDTPTPEHRWIMEPCCCFPNRVSLSCEPEIIHNPSHEATCNHNGIDCPDGTGDGCYDNRGGCFDAQGNLVDEDVCIRNGVVIDRPDQTACEVDGGTWTKGKSRKEHGAKEDDCKKSRCILNETGETVDIPQHSSCKDKDGETVSASNEEDCVTLISAGGACDGNQAPCSWTSGCEGDDYTWIEVSDEDTETWKEGSSGCPPIHIKTTPDAGCYDVPNSPKPVGETCPGLGSLDMGLKFDGSVWRSEWTLMNSVGTHQCDLGQHRFKWPANCQHTGPDDDLEPKFKTADILVAVNADCDGCDMSQSGMAGRPIDALADGGTPRRHRNIKKPTLPQDGHFIRLVMGCGGSIPSISAYANTDGRILDGGFPHADNYRDNGIMLWAEITNCTFTDFTSSTTLRTDRSDTGTYGAPPFYKRGCFSKKKLVGDQISIPLVDRSPSKLERKFTFAGRCLNSAESGPKGPCVRTECCTYNNRDKPFHGNGPLWSGAVACSQGGDIKQQCAVMGMDIHPEKPPESFTVVYVKDVDSKTGEGTLVVRAYPAGWQHCEHAYVESLGSGRGTDALVGIGVANLADAEMDTLGSYSRNNKSANPYLPAGGTKITGCRTSLTKPFYGSYKTEYTEHEGIPYGNNPADANGDRGRGNGEFMEIKVANIAPLITKNPRKSRHLRIFDRSGAGNLAGMDMLPNLDMAQPYGLNSWPVDHQTHSTTGDLWPKGMVMGPKNTESLRLDPATSLNQPGRVGPLPTMDNLNRMFRYTEEAMGDGTTTPIPDILPVEPVAINAFDNVYSNTDGYCTDPSFSGRDLCEDQGHIWIPNFLYTKVTTHMPNDLHDGEKVVISGSVTYPATCKGSRMGYCKGDTTLDINECNEGECVDTQLGKDSKWIKDDKGNVIDNKVDCMHASMSKQQEYSSNGQSVPELVFKSNGKWVQVFEDYYADQYICETVFEGTWVVGRVNDTQDGKGVYKDPLNNNPLKLTDEVKEFSEGCPVGCRLNGFYLTDPCDYPSEENPFGQCLECIEVTEGPNKENPDRQAEFRCPLGPADGNYVVRKRGCQHSGYTKKEDCEGAGWLWFGEVYGEFEFALHEEMNPFSSTHDASHLRSDLPQFKQASRTADGTKVDWLYDLSNVDYEIPTDAESCNNLSFRGFAWMDGGKESKLNAKYKSNKLASFGDSQSEYDGWLETYTGGRCVDARKLDEEFQHLFTEEAKAMTVKEKIDQGISTEHEQIQFNKLLSFGRSMGRSNYAPTYQKCVAMGDDDYGQCMKLNSNEEVLWAYGGRQGILHKKSKDYIQKRYCPESSVWVGQNLHLSEESCSEIALQDILIDPDRPSVHMASAFLRAESTINAVAEINDEKATLIATGQVEAVGGLEIGGEAELEANGWSEAWGTLYKLGQSTLNASATVSAQGTLTKFGRTGDDGINAIATIRPVPSDSSGTPSTSNSVLNTISTISATGTGGTESTPHD